MEEGSEMEEGSARRKRERVGKNRKRKSMRGRRKGGMRKGESKGRDGRTKPVAQRHQMVSSSLAL